MDSFPKPALAMVETMREAAAAAPERAVSFQGCPGANSHRAATEAAGDYLPLPCFSFADAIDAVKDKRAACAMIPIDNSQAGRVADIHFLLPESGLYIVGEHFLAIHHALMATDAKGPFTAAYSHPHALSQSRHYLRERGMTPLSFADTAGAAAHVAEMGDPSFAAIAPALAADLYGLEIVEHNVEDTADNTTRFVVLAREPLDPSNLSGQNTMTTIVFEVKNIPAALYKAMGGFATNGVNMTKLESYMVDGSFTATQFYAEVDGHPDDHNLKLALDELSYFTSYLHILGVYPAAQPRHT